MIDDARWRRVEEICGGALDRTGDERTAFVAAACADDETLRQEVQALLAHVSSTATFLGLPMGMMAAQVLSGVRGASLAGRQVGAYTLLSLLGAGGMGEVYRAYDARLARNVAIKVLSPRLTPDRSHRRRFLREAQAIAAGAQLGLGYTELLEDRVPEAQSFFHMALSVFERFDNRGRMTDAYFGLGDASFREGQFEQARAQYLRGLRLACGMGRRRDVARALQSVGVIAARRQQPHLATRCFAASNGLLEAVGCTLAPFESYGYEEALESARSELGLDPFQLLWNESRMVPIERIDELIHDT